MREPNYDSGRFVLPRTTACARIVRAPGRLQAHFDCWSSAAANGDLHRAIQSGKHTLEGGSGGIGQVLSGSVVRPVIPARKWPAHVEKKLGRKSWDVEHVGLVVSGRSAVAIDDGALSK